MFLQNVYGNPHSYKINEAVCYSLSLGEKQPQPLKKIYFKKTKYSYSAWMVYGLHFNYTNHLTSNLIMKTIFLLNNFFSSYYNQKIIKPILFFTFGKS